MFTVVATGSNLTYQWQRNGEDLTDGTKYSGTNTTTLTVMNVMEADEGNFTCVVTDDMDSITSNAAELTVRKCVCVCTHVFVTLFPPSSLWLLEVCKNRKSMPEILNYLLWHLLFKTYGWPHTAATKLVHVNSTLYHGLANFLVKMICLKVFWMLNFCSFITLQKGFIMVDCVRTLHSGIIKFVCTLLTV